MATCFLCASALFPCAECDSADGTECECCGAIFCEPCWQAICGMDERICIDCEKAVERRN